MLINTSKRRPNRERVRQIKAALTAALDLSEDATIMVTELECREEGCPPVETVLALLRPDSLTVQYKVHKSTVELDEKDLVHACETWGLSVCEPIRLATQ